MDGLNLTTHGHELTTAMQHLCYIQEAVRLSAYCLIEQHAPHPFAHQQSHRLCVGLATIPYRRGVPALTLSDTFRVKQPL